MWFLLLSLSILLNLGSSYRPRGCYNVDTIKRSLREEYCDQPLFVTFRTATEEIKLLDNVCHTYFPLPDDPDTFMLYIANVYCDGSVEIQSQIATQLETGTIRKATPYSTFTDRYFGYAGCDTYIYYRCPEFGGRDPVEATIIGVSPQCRSMGLSCLRKVEEIIKDNCLPDQDYYVLPMKLPNRCVTQQICLQPPNPFYGELRGYSGPYRVL